MSARHGRHEQKSKQDPVHPAPDGTQDASAHDAVAPLLRGPGAGTGAEPAALNRPPMSMTRAERRAGHGNPASEFPKHGGGRSGSMKNQVRGGAVRTDHPHNPGTQARHQTP